MKIVQISVRSKVGQPEELRSPHNCSLSKAAAFKIYTPDPALARLVAVVKKHPEVRAEVVLKIEKRLAAGDYLTAEAAEQTAIAMLMSEC